MNTIEIRFPDPWPIWGDGVGGSPETEPQSPFLGPVYVFGKPRVEIKFQHPSIASYVASKCSFSEIATPVT